MKVVKPKKPSPFAMFIRGVLGVFQWMTNRHKENRLTKPTFEDKEKFWRKEIREKLQAEKLQKEAKAAAKLEKKQNNKNHLKVA